QGARSWLFLGGGRRLPGLLRPVGRAPAPYFGALAPIHHARAEDVGHHIAVAAQQGLGGTHFGAGGQLALGQAVASVFFELGHAAVFFGAARAERAFVHFAAHTEGPVRRELRRAERTGIRTIAAADTGIFVVQHHAFIGAVKAI